MDYKNLYYRTLSSLFLIVLLLSSIYFLSKYLFIIITVLYVIIFYEVFKIFKINSFKLLFLFFYILVSYIAIQSYLIYFYNPIIFLYFVLIVVLFDSISYFAGSLFGKTKIFINLSPSKTYEGLFFGILITLIISYFINYTFFIFNNYYYIVFNLLVISTAFIGDILESYFKRKVNLKDSSNFLPGHGGFFDRFDGFILSVIPLFLFSYYLL
tara:strand:+ start:470 stop:1105 length:636 start_codon:yes stop_codon:yes gene_type:complete